MCNFNPSTLELSKKSFKVKKYKFNSINTESFMLNYIFNPIRHTFIRSFIKKIQNCSHKSFLLDIFLLKK